MNFHIEKLKRVKNLDFFLYLLHIIILYIIIILFLFYLYNFFCSKKPFQVGGEGDRVGVSNHALPTQGIRNGVIYR